MSYVQGTAIKELMSLDGMRRVDIVARDDGKFQFFEQFVISPDEGSGWYPGKVSGLYDTADVAEQAARAAFGLQP